MSDPADYAMDAEQDRYEAEEDEKRRQRALVEPKAEREERITAETLNALLSSGRRVQVTTYQRSTLYDQRHAGWFSESKGGDLYVRHGRGKVCLSYGQRLLVGIRVEQHRSQASGQG